MSVEVIHWSWSAAKSGLLSTLKFGLYGSLGIVVVGLVGYLFALRPASVFLDPADRIVPVAVAAWFLSMVVFVGVFRGILKGLSRDELAIKTIPNQGIYRSARTALISWPISGLISEVLYELYALLSGLTADRFFRQTLLNILSTMASVGLVFGLYTGGRACLQHLVLRLLLIRNGLTPRRYVDFLDFAAERIFLRKVGGGYIFIHRLLQDHFATLHTKVSASADRSASFPKESEKFFTLAPSAWLSERP